MNEIPRKRRKQNQQQPQARSTTPLLASGGRKLLSLPRLEGENEDFVVDEEDYLVVSEIYKVMGARKWQINERVRKMVDRESGDGRIHYFELPCVSSFSLDNLSNLPPSIGNLGSLKTLELRNTGIVSLPPSVGNLQSLESLDLYWAENLRYLPNEIGNLGSLKILKLRETGIVSLPPSLGNLRSLEHVSLDCTKNLRYLPNEIGNLVSLKTLELRDTGIVSLPPSVGSLRSLEYLYLKFTESLRYLPNEIVELRNLRVLDLRFTGKLSKLPEDIGERMTSLIHLVLYQSGITSLPESLGRLKGPLYLYGIGTTRIPEMEEGKDSEGFLLGLVQRWPSLGYLDINHRESRFHFDVQKTINFPLACNRARVRTGFSTAENNAPRIAPKLWPLALEYALRAFRLQLCWKYFVGFRIPPISKFDAVYQLLAICRASFIEALLGLAEDTIGTNLNA